MGEIRETPEMSLAAAIPSQRDDPCSEFYQNGLSILNMFLIVYPLQQFEAGRLGTHDIPAAAAKLHPLAQHGSLGATRTRHVVIQFTNAAARDHAQILALADPARRHAGLSSQLKDIAKHL